jgi:hypothetical protein
MITEAGMLIVPFVAAGCGTGGAPDTSDEDNAVGADPVVGVTSAGASSASVELATTAIDSTSIETISGSSLGEEA